MDRKLLEAKRPLEDSKRRGKASQLFPGLGSEVFSGLLPGPGLTWLLRVRWGLCLVGEKKFPPA